MNARPASGRVPAETAPVARLYADVALPHLDRLFDYLVPAELDAVVGAGSKVRVRFAGRLVDAVIIERVDETEHEGTLAFIERAIGEQPVLNAETAALLRTVADRWAGNFVDVLRLAVPPRHARAEASAVEPPAQPLPEPVELAAAWGRYPPAAGFADALIGLSSGGRAPHGVWTPTPGEDWPRRLAELALTTLAQQRGVVIVVPDARDLARLDQAMTQTLGRGHHVCLSADLGPAERYRRWLAVHRGTVRAVIGTRAAAYAPVADPGLLVIWDDGDDLHVEPRAPYPHVRDVLILRATAAQAALLIAGHGRTVEAAFLVTTGWAHELAADRGQLRAAMPAISAAGDEFELSRDPHAASARIPSQAIRAARAALEAGEAVLVQVPRRGYLPSLACAEDRTPARCTHCGGPLALTSGSSTPSCRWCGRLAVGWVCPRCGRSRLRAMVTGAGRTAEEFGRMFAGVPIRTSGGDSVLDQVPAGPQIVISTPGAEPLVSAGYGAALLLDGWALLSRPELDASAETLRRWASATALVAPRRPVIVMADPGVAVVQALIRWDAAGLAERELAERHELRFPPYARVAALTGPPDAIADLLARAELPEFSEVIGSIEVSTPVAADGVGTALAQTTPEPVERTLLRVPRRAGSDLAAALKAAAITRSARKATASVKIELDALELF